MYRFIQRSWVVGCVLNLVVNRVILRYTFIFYVTIISQPFLIYNTLQKTEQVVSRTRKKVNLGDNEAADNIFIKNS